MSIKLKKTLKIILKVALILFLIVSFNLLMMPKYIETLQDGRVIPEFYREKIDNDVVFVGSSTVYSGVCPPTLYKEYGITSFIRATSSQTSWITYDIIRETLERSKPKLVVIDIGFMKEIDDYAEEVSNRKAFDYMKWSAAKIEGINLSKAAEENMWDYVIPVLRYHGRWNQLKFEDFKYLYYKPDVTYNGYIMDVNTSASLDNKMEVFEGEEQLLTPRNEEYLRKSIELCKAHGVEVLLIKVPSYQPKWGDMLEEQYNRIADEYDIEYIDYNKRENELNIDYLAESPDAGSHLNAYGAVRFSKVLGKDIKDLFSVPDNRVNETVSHIWNKKLERFENDFENRTN